LRAGVIVCPGVTIGDHTAVGAGAVADYDQARPFLAPLVPGPTAEEVEDVVAGERADGRG
jgi:hypothetical protein